MHLGRLREAGRRSVAEVREPAVSAGTLAELTAARPEAELISLDRIYLGA
jgi:hypothetical protein